MLPGLLEVAELGKHTLGFPQSYLCVLLCPAVLADKAAEISEILYKLKWFTIY